MTTPRPTYTQLLQQLAAVQAEQQRLADELAQLRAGKDTATTADLDRALSRITSLETELNQVKSEQAAPAPTVDTAALDSRLTAVEQDRARERVESNPAPDIAALSERVSSLERGAQQTAPTPDPAPPVNLAPLEARVQQVEDATAQLRALPPPDTRVDALLERVAAVEGALKAPAAEEDSAFRAQVAALLRDAREAAEAAKQQAAIAVGEATRVADVFAREIADLKGQMVAGPVGQAIDSDRMGALAKQVDGLNRIFQTDAVLFTATTRKGLQVPNTAIGSDLDAAKLASGDIAAARMTANLISSFNATAGGASAAKITTGDLPTAQMQTNVPAAINASAGGVSAAKITTGDLPAAQMATNFASAFDGAANYTTTGVQKAGALRATNDNGGEAGTTTLTNVETTGTARNTGVGTILFADVTSRNNAGFMKVKLGTTTYYVPVFTDP